jgi:hypothetical protein
VQCSAVHSKNCAVATVRTYREPEWAWEEGRREGGRGEELHRPNPDDKQHTEQHSAAHVANVCPSGSAATTSIADRPAEPRYEIAEAEHRDNWTQRSPSQSNAAGVAKCFCLEDEIDGQ